MKKIILMAAFLFCAAQVCAQTTEDTGMPASLLAYDYFFPEKTSPADAGLTSQEGDAKLLKAVVLRAVGIVDNLVAEVVQQIVLHRSTPGGIANVDK